MTTPIDIRDGDILVVAGRNYPIRSAAWWTTSRMSARSFARLATELCSTLRSPVIAGGKRGTAVANLSGIKCTPLDPVDAETARRLAISTPYNLLQAFISNSDGYVHLVLEDVKH